jgi:hypothetical protein
VLNVSELGGAWLLEKRPRFARSDTGTAGFKSDLHLVCRRGGACLAAHMSRCAPTCDSRTLFPMNLRP